MDRRVMRRIGPPHIHRSNGLTLIEVSITLVVLTLILTGLMASLSTGFLAQRQNTDLLECQLLTQQVIEEVQTAPYATLLSFNGTHVDDTAKTHRAQILARLADTGLVQIEVTTASLSQPLNTLRAVTLISSLN